MPKQPHLTGYHELAHMWVPMMVGSNERRHAWMDEGTTTFNESQARNEFRPGRRHEDEEQSSYLGAARAGLEGELMRWSDYHYPGPAYGIASYSKPATLLATLRALLGPDTFDRTYREYLRRWRYRHPTPWDFFNTFNAVSGRNLDWFWRTWYYETWTMDQAVGSVTAVTAGTTILVEDRGLAPMPVRLTITRADGTTEKREIPVDAWLSGAVRADLNCARITIDDFIYPPPKIKPRLILRRLHLRKSGVMSINGLHPSPPDYVIVQCY